MSNFENIRTVPRMTEAEWRAADEARRENFHKSLKEVSGAEKLSMINGQRSPWDDTGRKILHDGEICDVTGNFSDGGVKYVSTRMNRCGNHQWWVPRFEADFIEEEQI